MTSILLFLAGALIAAVVLMLANQRRAKEQNERITSLSSEVSARQREAEMLIISNASRKKANASFQRRKKQNTN